MRPPLNGSIVGQTGAMMLQQLLGWVVLASSLVLGTAEDIDRWCDGLIPMTKDDARLRRFGLVQKRGWVEFKREPDLNAAVKAERVYDVARVWSREDGAIAISMTHTSGSGDWFHFVEYCYRTDGTLARLSSTLNTFNAVDKDPEKLVNGARRERDRYFDGTGKQIKVSKRVLDLKTKRPAPTLQVMDDAESIYKTTTALPFSRLLKSQGAAQPGGPAPRR